MKANDLRIGNLVNYLIIDEMDERKKWFEVSEIDYDDLRIIQNKHEVNQDYQPIQLTEEWLLKFGFKQTFISKIHLTFSKGSFHLLKRVNHIQIWYESIDVKYVHQLQNLYYALTNQELTI
jgi:hypothetical protein